MAPDAILVEQTFALRLVIVERDQVLLVVPVGLNIISTP
jgi:hypothetical protein